MTPRHPFHDPATHGFVRVAAATPGVAVSDPTCNADFAIDLAERAHAEHVDLVVFPELNLSSYAIVTAAALPYLEWPVMPTCSSSTSSSVAK